MSRPGTPPEWTPDSAFRPLRGDQRERWRMTSKLTPMRAGGHPCWNSRDLRKTRWVPACGYNETEQFGDPCRGLQHEASRPKPVEAGRASSRSYAFSPRARSSVSGKGGSVRVDLGGRRI